MNTNAKVDTSEIAALLDEPSARPWWQRRSVWGGVAAVLVIASLRGERREAAPSRV